MTPSQIVENRREEFADRVEEEREEGGEEQPPHSRGGQKVSAEREKLVGVDFGPADAEHRQVVLQGSRSGEDDPDGEGDAEEEHEGDDDRRQHEPAAGVERLVALRHQRDPGAAQHECRHQQQQAADRQRHEHQRGHSEREIGKPPVFRSGHQPFHRPPPRGTLLFRKPLFGRAELLEDRGELVAADGSGRRGQRHLDVLANVLLDFGRLDGARAAHRAPHPLQVLLEFQLRIGRQLDHRPCSFRRLPIPSWRTRQCSFMRRNWPRPWAVSR
jgi:hypothetical protein